MYDSKFGSVADLVTELPPPNSDVKSSSRFVVSLPSSLDPPRCCRGVGEAPRARRDVEGVANIVCVGVGAPMRLVGLQFPSFANSVISAFGTAEKLLKHVSSDMTDCVSLSLSCWFDLDGMKGFLNVGRSRKVIVWVFTGELSGKGTLDGDTSFDVDASPLCDCANSKAGEGGSSMLSSSRMLNGLDGDMRELPRFLEGLKSICEVALVGPATLDSNGELDKVVEIADEPSSALWQEAFRGLPDALRGGSCRLIEAPDNGESGFDICANRCYIDCEY